jgi:hypothetical protein
MNVLSRLIRGFGVVTCLRVAIELPNVNAISSAHRNYLARVQRVEHCSLERVCVPDVGLLIVGVVFESLVIPAIYKAIVTAS